MSAGFKFKEIEDAVLSGVDGIGIGLYQSVFHLQCLDLPYKSQVVLKSFVIWMAFLVCTVPT
jgi:hypothetical protein